jgi:hypothetical protein
METKTTQIKWDKEMETVKEMSKGDWFKAESDVEYIVKFLDEGGEPIEKVFEDRAITQVPFKVKVTDEENNSKECTWTVTKGGDDSCYGKLVAMFQKKGKATGVTLLITAVGDGKSRRYLVKEPRNVD